MITFLIGILSNLEGLDLNQIQQQLLEMHLIPLLKTLVKSARAGIKDQLPACNFEIDTYIKKLSGLMSRCIKFLL